MPKTLKFLPKWRKFCQIWSHYNSLHTFFYFLTLSLFYRDIMLFVAKYSIHLFPSQSVCECKGPCERERQRERLGARLLIPACRLQKFTSPTLRSIFHDSLSLSHSLNHSLSFFINALSALSSSHSSSAAADCPNQCH